jgi:hypothetical protein
MHLLFYISASLLTVGLSATPAVAFGPVQLVGPGSCLTPLNAAAPGDPIIETQCGDTAVAAEWIQTNESSSAGVHYVYALSGTVVADPAAELCLDARGGAANGTPIQL